MKLLLIPMMLVAAGGQGKTSAKGEGKIHAEGNGTIFVKGHGSLTLTGTGSLWYKDLGGDSKLTSANELTSSAGDWKFLSGIGTFSISGTGFIVMALGQDLKLDAVGKGKVHLVGKGTYAVHNRLGTWGDTPKPVPYGGAPALSPANPDKTKKK